LREIDFTSPEPATTRLLAEISPFRHIESACILLCISQQLIAHSANFLFSADAATLLFIIDYYYHELLAISQSARAYAYIFAEMLSTTHCRELLSLSAENTPALAYTVSNCCHYTGRAQAYHLFTTNFNEPRE